MRRVELTAHIPSRQPHEVFAEVIKFERFRKLAPHVAAVSVQRTLPEPVGESSWELHFRSGLLTWEEEEVFAADHSGFTFVQTDGDFDTFAGSWSMIAEGDGTELRFEAEFDFGIASLESILDPIAARVIKETVAWSVAGLFADVRLEVESDLLTDLLARQNGAPASPAGV